MYKCKCWNDVNFKEVYRIERTVILNSWELANIFDSKTDLLEILCEKCWDSTEDESIIDEKWEKILFW